MFYTQDNEQLQLHVIIWITLKNIRLDETNQTCKARIIMILLGRPKRLLLHFMEKAKWTFWPTQYLLEIENRPN